MIFPEKYFSYFILLTGQISLSGWLPLLHEILDNMCIAIICFPVCDMNFELTLAFLPTCFPKRSKKSEQKFKYLKNEKSFYYEV